MKIIHCNTPNKRKVLFDKEICSKHILVFGEVYQHLVSSLRIAILGLGGVGMILLEQVMRLFPELIVGLDFDIVSKSNLNRLTGTTFEDADNSILKTDLAIKHLSNFNPSQQYKFINGSFLDENAQKEIGSCDIIFSCMDSVLSRFAACQFALAHGKILIDLGCGAVVEEGELKYAGGQIVKITPKSGFCLTCSDLYDKEEAKIELLDEDELNRERAMGYVRGADIPEPQVYSLNMMTSAWAVWLMSQIISDYEPAFDGIAVDALNFHTYTWTERKTEPNNCPICGKNGIIFSGDKAPLLTKENSQQCIVVKSSSKSNNLQTDQEVDNDNGNHQKPETGK